MKKIFTDPPPPPPVPRPQPFIWKEGLVEPPAEGGTPPPEEGGQPVRPRVHERHQRGV